MRNVFTLYDDMSIWPKIFISAIPTGLVFYFAAFLSSSVSTNFSDRPQRLLLHAIIYVVLIIIVITFYRFIIFFYEKHIRKLDIEAKALSTALKLCNNSLNEEQKRINEALITPDENLGELVASVARIQETVDDAYETFTIVYGHQKLISERIDFEVTFMTKSYEDGEITIPCSANREKLKPISMVHREKDKEIYKDTETARLYKAARPDPIIVSDTSVRSYVELYPGQKNRIKSSIIYPILCDKNVLLGTLVIHCDQKNFFCDRDLKFWRELLEIFSKRIALEKLKIDRIHEATKNGPLNLEINSDSEFIKI